MAHGELGREEEVTSGPCPQASQRMLADPRLSSSPRTRSTP